MLGVGVKQNNFNSFVHKVWDQRKPKFDLLGLFLNTFFEQ